MNYKFGTKNNWRRWQWNRISDLIDKTSRAQSICIYLAGANDLDRSIALARGFKTENLIAIDSNKEVIDDLRKDQKLALKGSLIDILKSWPNNKPPNIIIADFCCGLEINILEELSVILAARFLGTVFSINFLRGRDSSSNAYRKALPNFDKHRAKIFLAFVATLFFTRLIVTKFNTDGKGLETPFGNFADNQAFSEWTKNEGKQIWIDFIAAFQSDFKPSFNSYYSESNQYFDSVVFINTAPQWFEEIKMNTDDDNLKRRITATLAHRTMRINKTGPYR